jgi:hypothetical protein
MPGTLKERYSLLLTEDSNGFFDELKEKALSYGCLKIIPVSETKVILEGTNRQMMKLIRWVLKNHLNVVKHLKSDTQNSP